MPSALRAQVALIGLLAVMLIPIGTSSLRGLTHILSCQGNNDTPFSIDVPEDGPPIVSSSAVITRDPDGGVPDDQLCGDLGGGTHEQRVEAADALVELAVLPVETELDVEALAQQVDARVGDLLLDEDARAVVHGREAVG